MQSPIASVFSWILRNFFKFLIIVAVLVAGKWLWREYQTVMALPSEIAALTKAGAALAAAKADVKARVESEARGLQAASSAILAREIARIEADIDSKEAEKRRRSASLPKLLVRPVADDVVAWARLSMEIECLRQERQYLSTLHTLVAAQTELERLRREHVRIYAALQANRVAQDQLRSSHPIAVWIPLNAERRELKRLEGENDEFLNQNQVAHNAYQAKRKEVEIISRLSGAFSIDTAKLDELLRQVDQAAEDRRTDLLSSPCANLCPQIEDAFLPAIGILIGLFVTPFAIKAFFYFALAPLAERRPPICLLPEESGTLGCGRMSVDGVDEIRMSGVSREIVIDSTNELLIHPAYLQSSSHGGRRDTKWLLDWSFPLTSIASEMVVLTRIRADGPETEVVSAPAEDPLSNVGVLDISEGAAVVLQPRCLAGVLTPRERPVRITRHWRILSMHAWLTLQFRYLVFHGPVSLILKGDRGIRVEAAGSSRRINQAATLGFNANLRYSTTRSRPFMAYLLAKQSLFEDSFAGDGFFVYEEMPHLQGRAGFTGRNLEAMVDAMLKAFGI